MAVSLTALLIVKRKKRITVATKRNTPLTLATWRNRQSFEKVVCVAYLCVSEYGLDGVFSAFLVNITQVLFATKPQEHLVWVNLCSPFLCFILNGKATTLYSWWRGLVRHCALFMKPLISPVPEETKSWFFQCENGHSSSWQRFFPSGSIHVIFLMTKAVIFIQLCYTSNLK